MTIAFLVLACVYVGAYLINVLDTIVCRNVRFKRVQRRRDLDWDIAITLIAMTLAFASILAVVFGIITAIEAIF